jgi:transcriptional regulator with XRE-family HTH domain
MPALLAEHIAAAQELVYFLSSEGTAPPAGPRRCPPMTTGQQREFGRLLRDRRNRAGLSRVQLARKAQLSDATIKFIETARHPPSRASLLRLIDVPALRLGWADVPGQHAPLGASLAAPAGLCQGGATAGDLLLVLDCIDFDELGDPVFVRRVTVQGQDAAHGPPLPRPAGGAVCELIPLRR